MSTDARCDHPACPPELNFAISSNRDFYRITFQVVIPSLLRLGYRRSQIWAFVGDEDCEFSPLEPNYGVQAYRVPIRAFEYTAALSILDYFPEPDRYWFLLHDTCCAGPEFRKRLEEFAPQGELVALSADGMNNIGICWTSHLQAWRETLDRYRGFQGERLQELKRLLIHEEGLLFRGAERSLCAHAPVLQPMQGAQERRIEYWAEMDFTKFKSNYVLREEYNLKL